MAHVMRYAHPDGLAEVTIATIAKEVLRGLEYVHRQVGRAGSECVFVYTVATAVTVCLQVLQCARSYG